MPTRFVAILLFALVVMPAGCSELNDERQSVAEPPTHVAVPMDSAVIATLNHADAFAGSLGGERFVLHWNVGKQACIVAPGEAPKECGSSRRDVGTAVLPPVLGQLRPDPDGWDRRQARYAAWDSAHPDGRFDFSTSRQWDKTGVGIGALANSSFVTSHRLHPANAIVGVWQDSLRIGVIGGGRTETVAEHIPMYWYSLVSTAHRRSGVALGFPRQNLVIARQADIIEIDGLTCEVRVIFPSEQRRAVLLPCHLETGMRAAAQREMKNRVLGLYSEISNLHLQNIATGLLPDTFPAFISALFIPETNEVMARRRTAGVVANTEWLLLDPDLAVRANVVIPDRFRLIGASRDHLLLVGRLESDSTHSPAIFWARRQGIVN